jgi:hypothetical protein
MNLQQKTQINKERQRKDRVETLGRKTDEVQAVLENNQAVGLFTELGKTLEVLVYPTLELNAYVRN